MTKLEALVADYWINNADLINKEKRHVSSAVMMAYEDGFIAAREMIASWLQEHTQHSNLFVPNFVPEQIRKMGEDKDGNI